MGSKLEESTDSAELAIIESSADLPAVVKSNSSALSNSDPLARYMQDVQRYSLLTREEEHELARKFVEEGDVGAAKQLVTSNLRLVVKIAYDYRRAYKNILDLVQEGNMGLMQAVNKFDPYRGVKLSTYAGWWIRAYMLKFILNNHRLVKLGTTQAQRKLFFNLRKEKSKLEAMGIEATNDKIAEALDVTPAEVEMMDRRLSSGEASLDAPIGLPGGKQVARIETMAGEGEYLDDALAANELGAMLSSKLYEYGNTLEGKEKVIFEKRLISDDPITLRELGEEFGVSRERVRQVEKRLMQKMKVFLTEELGEGVIDVLGEY